MTTYKNSLKAALVAAAVALAATPTVAWQDAWNEAGDMRIPVLANESLKQAAKIDQLTSELRALRQQEVRYTTECTDEGCFLKEAVSFSSHDECQQTIKPDKGKLSFCASLTAAAPSAK